jgi:glycosyltransferase involved in cell wall biosynthesis
MRVEAVSVCVNYADFLECTIDSVLAVVDDWVIVTTDGDKDTQRLCKQRGVRCVATDAFTRNGDNFNKARGINYGLSHLSCSDFILHIDSDIWLPPQTRHHLLHAELDPSCIYGVDRLNVVGFEQWEQFLAQHKVEPQYEWSCLVKPLKVPPLPLGARIIHRDYGGYCPLGFMQLFHGSQGKRYPIVHRGDAERTDILFGLQWPRPKRVLIPEVLAIHLESEPGPMGANWRGRATKRFGPTPSSGEVTGRPRNGLMGASSPPSY